jgi:hypothetical protein
MTDDNAWTVEPIASNVHLIRFDGVRQGWTQRILLTGDRHHDNKLADWKLERRHLDKARQHNAPIIDVGDFFCLMQGRYDPRKADRDLRPEHRGDDYFDLVMNEAEEFYKPYADLFAVIGQGNHEASVLKHNQIDFTKGIARCLQRASSVPGRAFSTGYSGWVQLRFQIRKTVVQTLNVKLHHGHGGGGPVTKGVIQTNRRAVYLPDADVVVTGHIHEAWVVPLKRERINKAGTVSQDYQWHVSVPTYKNEYDAGRGFHIETGKPPKPLGCAWLVLRMSDGRNPKVVADVQLELS